MKKIILNIFKLLLLVLVLILAYPLGYRTLDVEEQYYEDLNVETAEGVVSYIINLDRSRERYDYIRPSVEQIGFAMERISAVDGRLLSEEEILSVVDMEANRLYAKKYPGKGEVGCSLSHIEAWKRLLNSNFEFAIIFEDDVSFDPKQARAALDELVKEENKNLWDIVTLEQYNEGWPLKIKELDSGHHLVVYLRDMIDAGAYVINRQAAQKLLSKALPTKMGVDHYYNRDWELGLKFTGIENERIARQTFGDSNIKKTEWKEEPPRSYFERIKRKIYRLQISIVKFFYNLKLYYSLRSY